MMNFDLTHLPDRSQKPRSNGLNMIMDKGLSVNEAKNMLDAAAHLIDFVKLGFGTSAITAGLDQKINVYRDAGIKVYFGGTLFEAFVVRGRFQDFQDLLKRYNMDTVEVSDGSMRMNHDEKCGYISELAKSCYVLSEVGSKMANVEMSTETWIHHMNKELQSGSSMVIAEARESGTVGIYQSNGNADAEMIHQIMAGVPEGKVLWEAPLKNQQIWFIKELGCNVNLGNIATNEVIPLETLRLGLRGDTFFQFLPEAFQKFKQ